jgi:hypothetical protein
MFPIGVYSSCYLNRRTGGQETTLASFSSFDRHDDISTVKYKVTTVVNVFLFPNSTLCTAQRICSPPHSVLNVVMEIQVAMGSQGVCKHATRHLKINPPESSPSCQSRSILLTIRYELGLWTPTTLPIRRMLSLGRRKLSLGRCTHPRFILSCSLFTKGLLTNPARRVYLLGRDRVSPSWD